MRYYDKLGIICLFAGLLFLGTEYSPWFCNAALVFVILHGSKEKNPED
jgi:hypothetical protein